MENPGGSGSDSSRDGNNNSFNTLGYDHEALFGNIHLQNLTDEELNAAHDLNLSKRRDKLIIAKGLLNGCLVRVMLDTGFTGGLIIAPDAATRFSFVRVVF